MRSAAGPASSPNNASSHAGAAVCCFNKAARRSEGPPDRPPLPTTPHTPGNQPGGPRPRRATRSAQKGWSEEGTQGTTRAGLPAARAARHTGSCGPARGRRARLAAGGSAGGPSRRRDVPLPAAPPQRTGQQHRLRGAGAAVVHAQVDLAAGGWGWSMAGRVPMQCSSHSCSAQLDARLACTSPGLVAHPTRTPGAPHLRQQQLVRHRLLQQEVGAPGGLDPLQAPAQPRRCPTACAAAGAAARRTRRQHGVDDGAARHLGRCQLGGVHHAAHQTVHLRGCGWSVHTRLGGWGDRKRGSALHASGSARRHCSRCNRLPGLLTQALASGC